MYFSVEKIMAFIYEDNPIEAPLRRSKGMAEVTWICTAILKALLKWLKTVRGIERAMISKIIMVVFRKCNI